MTGRPTKCTPDRVKRIIDALKGGNTRKASAAYGGIDIDTFGNWMNRGAAGEEPFSDFSEQVKAAEAEAEVRNVAIIAKAATEKWQAAAWWLERRKPADWAQTTKHTGGDGQGPVEFVIDLVKPKSPVQD